MLTALIIPTGMPMLIIDRYLLRQFIHTFVICFVSLVGLYIVIDAFTHLDSFMECAEVKGGLAPLMIGYYSYQSLAFFNLTSGMLALIAAMFTVTWIQRHNEMTALMAAGVPRIRVVKPVLIAAAVVSLIATINRELVIPCFREELSRTSTDLVGDKAKELEPQYDCQTDVLIGGESTFAAEKRISKPRFSLPAGLDLHGRELVAENAFFQPAENGRPAGYLLVDVRQPKNIAALPSLSLGERRVIITPLDEPQWLKPNECFLASNVAFDQLSGGQGWAQYASTFQLIRGLHNPSLDFGADTRVAIHSRIVNPLLDITLLFLGLPLVLTRENRNVFAAIGLCIMVVSVFVLVTLAMQHIGANYFFIPPALAAWAPLMLFVPAAVGMAGKMWE